MHSDVACTTLRRLEDLTDLEPAWRELWAADPHATPFQRPEWLIPWAQHFGSFDLRTVLVYDRGSLTAVLPFYRYLEPHGGERRLLFLGAGTSDYLDGVYGPTCAPHHLQVALHYLCCENDWDTLDANQLRQASKLLESIREAPLPGLRQLQGETCSRFPAAPLASLPRSIRRQATYYHNYAMRAGRLDFTVANEHHAPAIFDELERLHTSRWQSSGQPGLLADSRVRAWHRQTLPALLRGGMVRLFALSLDGEIIAALYSLLDPPDRAERTLYLYMAAYSIDHAALRPGTVLMAMAAEHAAQEGAQMVDMLRGDEPYKRLWKPQRVPTFGFSMPRTNILTSFSNPLNAGRAAA